MRGRCQSIYTDHRPLIGLVKKPIAIDINQRVLRALLTISAYQVTLKFRPDTKNGNTDALSRVPRPHGNLTEEEFDMILHNIDSWAWRPVFGPTQRNLAANLVTVLEHGLLSPT